MSEYLFRHVTGTLGCFIDPGEENIASPSHYLARMRELPVGGFVMRWVISQKHSVLLVFKHRNQRNFADEVGGKACGIPRKFAKCSLFHSCVYFPGFQDARIGISPQTAEALGADVSMLSECLVLAKIMPSIRFCLCVARSCML